MYPSPYSELVILYCRLDFLLGTNKQPITFKLSFIRVNSCFNRRLQLRPASFNHYSMSETTLDEPPFVRRSSMKVPKNPHVRPCTLAATYLAKNKMLSAPWSSQVVSHPSTTRALRRLTSEFGRDLVFSTQCGRQLLVYCRVKLTQDIPF